MFAIDNYDFKGKRAIIRVDFNVPLDAEGKVTDDTRIRAAIPTIKKVLEKGGSVILMSHLGRPKKNNDMKFSLEQIIPAIEARLGVEVKFAGDCIGDKAAQMAAALKPGEVMLLENLRFYAEEEGKPRGLAEDATDEQKAEAKAAVKASQKDFVKRLASYADCYINDAFGTAHRLRRHRGRFEGVDQDHHHREADGEVRQDHHRRRHDLHLRCGSGRQGR